MFKKGVSDNRRTGTRITSPIMDAVLGAGEDLGFVGMDENGDPIATGVDGMRGYMRWLGLREPKAYANLVGRILPMTIMAQIDQPKEYSTLDEAIADAKAQGLDDELAFYMRKYPLERDENPSPYVAAEFKKAMEWTGLKPMRDRNDLLIAVDLVVGSPLLSPPSATSGV
jgi:hypothetical protein